jgi:hypothetical protein
MPLIVIAMDKRVICDRLNVFPSSGEELAELERNVATPVFKAVRNMLCDRLGYELKETAANSCWQGALNDGMSPIEVDIQAKQDSGKWPHEEAQRNLCSDMQVAVLTALKLQYPDLKFMSCSIGTTLSGGVFVP